MQQSFNIPPNLLLIAKWEQIAEKKVRLHGNLKFPEGITFNLEATKLIVKV